MANYFGIDFGTTNSAVVAIAAIDGNRVGDAQKIGEDERHPQSSVTPLYKGIPRDLSEDGQKIEKKLRRTSPELFY